MAAARLLSVAAVVAAVAVAVAVLHSRPKLRSEASGGCSLLAHDHFWVASRRVVTPSGVAPAAVEVKQGFITTIKEGEYHQLLHSGAHILDFDDAVIMPGLVDIHVHLDEPGREEWEGFSSGTKAAAAGGVTTLIDMPLNSMPSTVSKETLELKIQAAKDKIYVDVGFWGGLIPENAFDRSALDDLLRAGALGLKSFMCPSGINDFPMTNATHIKEGLTVLTNYKRPLLVHSELVLDLESKELDLNELNPRSYATYLQTRPASWEAAAISELQSAMHETESGGTLEGAHIHIVHLSDSHTSLDLIKEARHDGASVTVETCPHYLAFSAEEIPDGNTRFKCAPPIRDAANRQRLWEALLAGDIDMLSSDHSPSVPDLKLLQEGNFLKAWGGISSLQLVLPVTWFYGQEYGITLSHMASWWSERPAKLAGQELKGGIVTGKHADFVVWKPEVEFTFDENYVIYHKHRDISAYAGKKLLGKVLATFSRGNLVYNDGKLAAAACGKTLLAK